MEFPVYRSTDRAALWRIASFGSRQRTNAGQRYWWNNRDRPPLGLVVVQATHEGSIDYRGPAGREIAGPGSLLLFAYGEDADYGSRDPLPTAYVCSWINLQGAGLLDHVNALRERFGNVRDVGRDHPLFSEFNELIHLAQPRRATPPTFMAAALHTFIMHLFEQAEESRRQALPPVRQAVESILRQPHLIVSLDNVADRFGCAREHLSRTFHEEVGEPPAEYIADAKRRRALRLLRDSDLPLAEVARQAGFATARTMTRQLRAATGQTPSQLRAAR